MLAGGSKLFRALVSARCTTGEIHNALAPFATYSANTRIISEEDRTGFPLCVSSKGNFSISPEITRQDIIRFFHGVPLTERDVRPQYNAMFRPMAWWVKFHTPEDRTKSMQVPQPRWGGRMVGFEEKTMRDWQEGTFNHLVGESFGTSVVVSKMASQTADSDVASFFRNFHLAGNGVTLIQDAYNTNIRPEDQFKRAIVRLISPEEAQRATRSLHRRYMRNARVTVKVVQ
ncbi:hypothetical protein BSKO_01138 [Bryopsis sp. KO-2023]|nr:hypothetical protein BSKO_01138 [Bryopsis sp. KO-2023]